jgi:transcriptional regulator with GAF, ATPase, and Fis domain/tetratricopeptide (TPR) repeat protein
MAAMFEEEFSIDWLEELTGLRATSILSVVERAVEQQELLRKEPGVYAFTQGLRKAWWRASLAADEKERYYRSIAAIMMRELADDDQTAVRVARYLRLVSNDAEGCRWLIRAGKAHGEGSTEMAIDCFAKAAEDLIDKEGEVEDSLFVEAVLDYSNAATLRTDTLKTLSLLDEAKVRAKRLGSESFILLIEMHIAKQEWLKSHDEKAVKRFESALASIERTNQPDLLASIIDLKYYFLFFQGRFREVVETYERSLPEVERYPSGSFPVISAITVARSYGMTGQLTQGLGMLHTIYDRCLEKGDLYLASHAGSAIAILLLGINRPDDAFRYFKSSLRQANETRNHYVALVVTFMLALAYKRKGENKKSVLYLSKFLKNLREFHVSLQLYPYLMEICWAMEMETFPRLPGLSLEDELKEMLGTTNVLVGGIAYRYQALLGKIRGWSNQRVIRSLTISEGLLEKSGHRIECARTQLELARCHLIAGDIRKVRRIMKMASETLSTANAEMIPDDLRTFVYTPNREKSVLAGILGLSGEIAATGREKNQLLQQIVATINRLIGAERGAILLIGPEAVSPTLTLRASKNLTMEQVYHQSFSNSRSIIEEVVRSGQGRMFEIGPFVESGTQQYATVSSGICVPFFLEDRTAGILYHDNRLLNKAFSESDLKLLQFFSALVAADLGWAKAREEIKTLSWNRGSETIAIVNVHELDGSDDIVGISQAIQQVRAEIARVAETDAAVLILGETGVGKNLVASAAHRQSLRKKGPFVTVHCSALTESLITSELFGHERGAFTGATDRRIGRVEMADNGSLFLDEIGDLSLDIQARLLRVLQSKEFERVGGGKETLTSDFRLIAATNRSLEDDVEAQRFRRDLYYRINVFPLYVPPLRERREDIPLLARHFLKIYASKTGKTVEEIPKEQMEKLIAYHWPGNVRELQNAVQRALILGDGRRFVVPDLGKVRTDIAGVSRHGSTSLQETEKRHILEILNLTGWRIYGPRGAARMLAIKPTTLCSRMKKLGIKRPSANLSAGKSSERV